MLTFHKIIEGCRAGDAEAWRALIAQYTPVLTEVAKVYSSDSGRIESAWQRVLGGLAAQESATLKKVEAQSDREFFSILRASLLEQMADGFEEDSARRGFDPSAALEDLGRLMKELPLIHQNVVFLKLTGYSESTIEQILRISPAVAKSSVERLNGAFLADFRSGVDAAGWQVAWLTVIHRMHANQTADCAPVRKLIRILDGQFGWYEKDPVEKHLASCLHCLEAWVGLQEVNHWMRRGTPLTPGQEDEIVSTLPLKTKTKERLPLIKRVFR